MKLKYIIIWATLSFLALPAFAQNTSPKKISSILITGNDHTNEDIIKRELRFGVGDTLNDSLLNVSKNRLLNLWIFNRVEMYKIPDQDEVSLLINVTERFSLFPYPEFRVEDRDWSKLTLGFGFAHMNFRGRNEKLYGSLLFGFRPGFKIGYFNPWAGGDLHLTTGLYIKKFTTEHRTLPFDEDHLTIGFALGKYWTLHFYNMVNFTYDQVTVPKEYAPLMLTGDDTETLNSLRLSTVLDTRDLYDYPSKGWYNRFVISKNGLFEPDIDYWQYITDLRHYRTYSPLTFAARFYTLQSIGTLPLYQKVYIGFDERVRGHFFDVYEGRHSMLGSFEIRFPIKKLKYYSLSSGIMPSYGTSNLKFGINGGLFIDTGTVWTGREGLSTQHFVTGFGAGLHFRLPYIQVLRIDAAFDEDFNSEMIIELGINF